MLENKILITVSPSTPNGVVGHYSNPTAPCSHENDFTFLLGSFSTTMRI